MMTYKDVYDLHVQLLYKSIHKDTRKEQRTSNKILLRKVL